MSASADPSVPPPALYDLGWDDAWAATLSGAGQSLGAGEPARVARVDLGACTVLGGADAARVTVGPETDVTVGDWVLVRDGVVVGVLPRRTAIVRRAAGGEARAQALAANVDTVLILVAADGRVTPRSVERYLTLAWESGAAPVVVLTKADLVSGADLDDVTERLEAACVGVDLVVVSVPTGAGLDDLAGYLGPGRTVALLGASGAGKSTLANHLAGADLATGAVREGDRRGRHTTTHRELLVVPAGGVLIDSPGLREVGLWQADPSGAGTQAGGGDGLARTFPEITALLGRCRFADCSHRQEPGCAVMAAVADGTVSEDRLAGWRKLRRELDRLAARDDPALREQLRTEQRRLHREYAQARKRARRNR